ncbi:MAG: TIGR02757 family protein [Flavobacteriaceae bacterium]
MGVSTSELRDFLNQKATQYNKSDFVATDPIQIPKQFTDPKEIEIAGFFAATIAWGNRASIIKNAQNLMERMGHTPYDFVMHASEADLKVLKGFTHRTFNEIDARCFVYALRNIYASHDSMESLFTPTDEERSLHHAISRFRKVFFSIPYPERTSKHVSNPQKGSAAKRLHMFLRWMVRQDPNGVDFGIWKNISPSKLSCPLDVHSGNVARKLGLLKRKQNDLKALIELDTQLRKLDPQDPVKYDFALFGLGVFEKF